MTNINNNEWYDRIISSEFSNLFSEKYTKKKTDLFDRVSNAVITDYKCKLLALQVFKLKNMTENDAYIYIKYSVERYYQFFRSLEN